MRVIELFSISPMRLGPGGNIMPQHLVETLARPDRAPQAWCRVTGKHPHECVSMAMQLMPSGDVMVSVEEVDGSTSRYVVKPTTVTLEPLPAPVKVAPALPPGSGSKGKRS